MEIKKLKNTVYPFTLADGTEIKMTMNFMRLLALKSTNKARYEKFNKIMMDGPKDIFDNVELLYTGYLCALDDQATAMSYEAFLENMPDGINAVNSAVNELINPKKKKGSENHL